MLNIKIKTIANQKQRYNTVGDYQTDASGEKKILVSEMEDVRYELLIAVHELIEAALCDERGISEKDIDAFDMAFEKNRLLENIVTEPGDDANAPYNKEHVFATKIERMIADELGVDWDTYSNACSKLTKEYLD